MALRARINSCLDGLQLIYCAYMTGMACCDAIKNLLPKFCSVYTPLLELFTIITRHRAN